MTFKLSAACFAVLFLTSSVSSSAPFYAPSFEGTWEGKADITTCSRAAGSAIIVLKLEDKGYLPKYKIPNIVAVGSVSGELEINGNASGIVGLNYESNSDGDILKSALSSVRPVNPSPLGGPVTANSPFSTYWVQLKAGDAYGGFGRYQSLTGTFAHSDSGCPNLGDAGTVMKVTLKKR
ncbi:MAG TPA: hypothetical protein VI636_14540 [Candidatus Angelobacter sp.]